MMCKLMKFVILVILVLFPTLTLSQNCPTFQSAVKLNSSIASNLSFAMIADGKYYLIDSKEEDNESLEPTGDMPKGFTDSRATIVIDRLQCNNSQYYLLTLETLAVDQINWITFYTTLDLLNWNRTTRWSEPKPISEYPMLANDPYIKLMSMLEPNFVISKFVNTMFYWDQMETIFVVMKLLSKSNSKVLRYYSIDMQNKCEESYTYSKSMKDFEPAVGSVVNPLDLCFIDGRSDDSDSLLYCIGSDSFQVNAINSQFSQSSGLRTKLISFPNFTGFPTTHHLPMFRPLCKSQEPVHESGIIVRIKSKNAQKLNNEKIVSTQSIDLVRTKVTNNPSSVTKVKVESNEDESSSIVLIAVIFCLLVIVLVFLVVFITTARKRSAVTRM